MTRGVLEEEKDGTQRLQGTSKASFILHIRIFGTYSKKIICSCAGKTCVQVCEKVTRKSHLSARCPAMVPALLLASLAAPQSGEELSSTADGTRDIVIGVDRARYGVLYWDAMPQPDQELHVTVGVAVTCI